MLAQALIKDYKLDMIYRIFRIFFVFPEERQEVSTLFEGEKRWQRLEAKFPFPAFGRDCTFSVSSGN